MAGEGALHRFVLLAALVTSTACARAAVNGRVDAAPGPAGAEVQVSDRLFFGRSIPGGGQVSDSAWTAFLAEVVTSRFPEGLTVWRAEGQWLDPRAELVREPVMVVEVLHPRGIPADSVFERIATEYRQRFQQDAVLQATTETRTRLYSAPRH